jgi:hypothetical protein
VSRLAGGRELGTVALGSPRSRSPRLGLLTQLVPPVIIVGGAFDEFTMGKIETSTQAERRSLLSLERLRLRFRDPALEAAYRDDRFRHNVVNIRFAFMAEIGLWISWGLLLRPPILALSERRLDTIMRFGVHPDAARRPRAHVYAFFRRIWQSLSVIIATATLLLGPPPRST